MSIAPIVLDVRLFLHYDLDEALPWHSTITRQLYGETIFLSLFQKVLSMCVNKGMVRGKRQAIDSAFIKANASMDSLVEKEVIEDASAYVEELNEGSEFKVTSTRKKLTERHHTWKKEACKQMPGNTQAIGYDENGVEIRPKFLSNHTHYSPTDPDAKISVKPGKARQLNYSGQISVDDAHHIITGACGSRTGSRDSENLSQILAQTIENLLGVELKVDQILGSTNQREGFIYHQETDQYECIQIGGNAAILSYKGIKTDSKGYNKKHYRSSETDCKSCPLREQCCGKATKFKK